MPRIFISYRRADSQAMSDRIYDRLTSAFGMNAVFMDVDNIQPGADFRQVLINAVSQCDICLVLIGPKWASIADSNGSKRLSNEHDFVRIEIEAALKSRKHVIPVLVDNAQMPSADQLPSSLQALSFRNAIAVRHNPDFSGDIQRLIKIIRDTDSRKLFERKTSDHNVSKSEEKTTNFKTRIMILIASIIILFFTITIAFLIDPQLRGFLTANLSSTTPSQTPTLTPTLTETPTVVISPKNTLTPENIEATRNMESTAVQIVLALTATQAALQPTITPMTEPTAEIRVPSNTSSSLWQVVPSFMAGLLIASTVGGFYFWQSNRKHSVLPRPVLPPLDKKEQDSQTPSVFISYKRVPSSMLAVLLGKSLTFEKVDAFVDVYQQDGAGSFPTHLYDEIGRRDIFVCLLSNETLKSDWVLKEIRYAYDKKKPMIPVLQESFKDWLPKKGANSYSAFLEKLKAEGYPIECIQSLVSSKGIHFYDQDNQYIDYAINNLVSMIKETHKKHYAN